MSQFGTIALESIEKDPSGHFRPALLRRAVFVALDAPDNDWPALKQAFEERGIALPSTTDPERLFANAKHKEHWARPIAALLGQSVHTLYPDAFPNDEVGSKTVADPQSHLADIGVARQPLTPNERALLNFITAHIGRHGYSPSFREMSIGIGYRSKCRSHLIVENLIRKGHLVRPTAGKHNGLALVNPLANIPTDELRTELKRRGEVVT